MTAAANVAAMQAELMEKEKSVIEAQQRLALLRDTLKTLAGRQVSLHRDKRRSEVTVKELSGVSADHNVYNAVGRAFAKVKVSTLVQQHQENMERCEAEDNRLGTEKFRLAEAIKKDEESMRHAVEDLKTAIQLFQAAQPQQSS